MPRGLPPDFDVDHYVPPEPFDEWEILTWYGRMPDGQPSVVVFRHAGTGRTAHHQHRMLGQIRLGPNDEAR
jgi:hypothetical protein